MVDWCPKCGAMLASGQVKCPACGTRMRANRTAGRDIADRPDFDTRDIFWLSLYIVGIALIPILLVVMVAVVCVLVAR